MRMATGRQSVAKEGLQVRAAELEGKPLIMSGDSKPFNPEEVRVIVTSLQQPAVFLNMVSDWPALKWNVEHLSRLLNGKPLKFRIGERKVTKVPQFETHCEYIQATLQEFLDWLHDESDDSAGQFAAFPRSRYWGYCDYKYVAMVFEEKAEVFQKEMASFPPEDTASLYPTRIPYEESSVFSSVNVVNPDLEHFPRFHGAKPHVVTLHPGEVLFVPRHWWHYVESLDPVTVSINSWIELDDDDETRVGEALARTVVCALKAADPHVPTASWLNTTEAEVTSHETNLHYVNLAVQACIDKRKVCSSKGRNPSARSLPSFKRRKCDSGDGAGYSAVADADPKPALTTSIPFGPNLLPVVQDTGATAKHRVPSDSSKVNISLSNNLEANNCSGKVGSNSKNTGVHSTTISTDELLNCLVHPDVISLMTEILLDCHFSH